MALFVQASAFLQWFCGFFFFQAEDGIRDSSVTGVQTCALPISSSVLCRPQDRGPEHDPTMEQREQPVEDLDACRYRDDHRHNTEEGVDVGARAHCEEVMQPNHE